MRSLFVLIVVSISVSNLAEAGLKGVFSHQDPRSEEERNDNSVPTHTKNGRPLAPTENPIRRGADARTWERFVVSHQSTPAWMFMKVVPGIIDVDEFRQQRREVLKLSKEETERLVADCKEGGVGDQINCLRASVQKFLKDPKNLKEGDKADCEAHAYALESALQHAFKDQPDLKFKATFYSNHALIEMAYTDPKTKGEYVYHLDSGIDKGKYTDLHPKSVLAIRNDIPKAIR